MNTTLLLLSNLSMMALLMNVLSRNATLSVIVAGNVANSLANS